MAFWVLCVFEPQEYLMHVGLTPAGKLVTLLAALTALTLLFQPPSKGWVPPLLVNLIFIISSISFVVDRGSAYEPIKAMIVLYVLTLATLGWVRDAAQARPIILMVFLGQFLWWGAFGVLHGAVPWHSNLANYDGYGPMMSMGIGLGFYFGLAARDRRLRWLGFLAALMSVAGVVGSFARGAVLGAIAVLGYVWFRWPQKGRATMALIAVGIVVAVTGSLLSNVTRGGDTNSPKGFFNDFLTVTNELNSENGGSSNDRRMLWSTATILFKQSPIVGVGVGNFGPTAATLPRELFAQWDFDNPARLWGRALHSSYYQILCEEGLIGCVMYVWLLFEFFSRNAKLRKPGAIEQWRIVSGGEFDLRYLSWGLEAGMIGFLSTALFYNQLYVHWLYTLFIVNVLLYQLTRTRPETAARGGRAR